LQDPIELSPPRRARKRFENDSNDFFQGPSTSKSCQPDDLNDVELTTDADERSEILQPWVSNIVDY